MDEPTNRVVNGERVQLSPAEVAAQKAEWEANPPPTEAQVADAQAQAAVDVLGGDSPVGRVVSLMLDEINVLRAALNLPALSGADLLTKVKAKRKPKKGP